MHPNPLLFSCQFGDFPPDLFQVLTLESQHDAVGACYQYCIGLFVPHHIDPASLASLPVQLFVKEPLSLLTQGHISRYEKRDRGKKTGYHLKIWINPWFFKLNTRLNARVFVDKTPQEITDRIFTENQIPVSYWHWHVPSSRSQANTKPLPLLLQINEKDTDFLQRLWAKQGYAFLFEQTRSISVLHIADVQTLPFILKNDQAAQSLTYYPQKGMTRQPNSSFDWSYTLQENAMPVLTLKTLAQDIHVGHRIQFTEPDQAWLSGEYWVIRRHMRADQRRTQAALDYCCTLDLIQVNTAFTLPRMAAPIYPGLQTAYIDNGQETETTAPDLNEAGDYWIRFPFDTVSIPSSPGSNRVRFATAFGGSNSGWHFPLRHGTQVALTLRETQEGGHEATIVGTIPDAQTPTPLDLNRPSCHRLRSYRENTFEADDHVDTGYTALFTHHRNNEVRLSANTHENRILLKSKKQAIHLTAHEDMMINSQQNIQVRAKENGIEIIENTYTLFAEQDIRFTTAAARIDCAKETRIMSKTDSKIKTTTLSWSAQKTFSLRVLGHMQGWVETARLTAHNISITSTGDAPLILSQGHAQSYFDASGNLCFFANQFFIKAPLISIYSNSEQSS